MLCRTRMLLVIVVALVGGWWSSLAAVAQETGASAKDDAKRLPAYFKEVVDEKQKAEIYKVQVTFDKQLEALEARNKELTEELKTLRAQIDGIKDQERLAVEALLTPKQVAQIKRLRAEAQSRLAQELLKAAEEAARRADQLATPE